MKANNSSDRWRLSSLGVNECTLFGSSKLEAIDMFQPEVLGPCHELSQHIKDQLENWTKKCEYMNDLADYVEMYKVWHGTQHKAYIPRDFEWNGKNVVISQTGTSLRETGEGLQMLASVVFNVFSKDGNRDSLNAGPIVATMTFSRL